MSNKQVLLVKRPRGKATEDCFKVVESPIPAIADGQVLVKNTFLSLDPYMRGRMDDRKSYAKPQALGEVMLGETVGVVMDSKNPAFPIGASVVSNLGWQQYAVADGDSLELRDTTILPLSVYTGVVGMPGITAWYGLNHILMPKEGETVAVSSACGAVGSVVGQLAKLKGCRVVGIAGGKEKCDYAVTQLGFDACVDYKAVGTNSAALIASIQAAAPAGIDCYFENVGGMVGNAVMQCMNASGRIAVCGLISAYDGVMPVALTHPHLILTQRLLVRGFIVSEYLELWPAARQELGMLVAAGKVKYRETVLNGIEAAPAGLLSLLRGGVLGKLLVRL